MKKAIAFKRNLLVGVVLLVVAVLLAPNHGLANPDDNLVGHWNFDEGSGTSLSDVTGQGHTGTIYGGETWVGGVGGSGYALQFDGVNDYVEIANPSSFAFDNHSLTITAWVQIVDNDPNKYRKFVALGDASDASPQIHLGKSRGGAREGRVYLEVYNSGDYRLAMSDLDGNQLPKNQWIFLAGVVNCERSTSMFYVNGVLQNHNIGTLPSFYLSQAQQLSLWFGACAWFPPGESNHNYHRGLIDEVRIYNIALSAEEIDSLYDLCAPENQPTLVLKDGSPAHTPIANKAFKIYKVTNDPPTMTETYLGELTTDGNGKITLPEGWFVQDEWVKVERLLHTEPAVRHTSILPNMYYVKLDNAKFNTTTGAISYYPLSSEPEQEVIVDHTTIMYDLLVSVEWDADQQYLDNLWIGLKNMSNYLFDISDGQIYLNKALVYDNSENWSESDIKVHTSNMEWPHVRDAWNMRDPWYWFWNSYIHMPRVFFGNQDANRNHTCWYDNWYEQLTNSDEFRTKCHEFGHYGLGFYDEYVFASGIRCDPSLNYGFMDNQYSQPYGSEMSSAYRYVEEACQNTSQYDKYHASCWDYLEREWEKYYSDVYCPIIRPSEGNVTPGFDYFCGPNDGYYYDNCNYDVGQLLLGGIDNNETGGTTVLATCYDFWGNRLPKADIWLTNAIDVNIYQGQTADAYSDDGYKGKIRVLGYHSGWAVSSTLFARVVIGDKGSTIWLYGEATLNGSGLSKYGNLYRVSADADSVDIFLKAVQGDYPLIHAISLSTGTPEYILYTSQPFSENPSLELHPDDNPVQTYTFQPTPTGYSVSIPDDMRNLGMFTLLALDDSSSTFFVNTSYSFTDSIDTSTIAQVVGPGGECDLYLDSLNSGLEKVSVLSSPYPPLRTGLDPLSEQAGEIFSLSSYPSGTLLGSNSLIIHYADSDLRSQPEATLEIFKWNESLLAWELLCGGFIDTVRNFVGTSIDSLGVYAAFTTGYLRGDANGDGLINVVDVVYLINYLFISGPAPNPLEAGDCNCDGNVDVSDVVYLINYLFIGGPSPKC